MPGHGAVGESTRLRGVSAMRKTVLLITDQPAHRRLYRRCLEQHFRVEIDTETEGKPVVDAIIFDVPEEESPVDIAWLEALDIPVVVLTCQDSLSTGESHRRRILTYPVSTDQLLRALAGMGIQ